MKIINPLKIITRPEYLFRPDQVFHRLKRIIKHPNQEGECVVLPWGDKININVEETIGAGIWAYGIFDLIVGELITRLLDKDERALDIGGNIGQFTLLMASIVGSNGMVKAFEPHPVLFNKLEKNCIGYINGAKNLEIYNIALGSSSGEAVLLVEADFSTNSGTSRVANNLSSDESGIIIKIAKLDEIIEQDDFIGVCKIDVEGHEKEVLKGASNLLENRRIRDILYEDINYNNSPLRSIFEGYGYTIFSIHTDIFKPRISPVTNHVNFKIGQEGENFLATLEPSRAIKRLSTCGYKVLKSIE